MTPPLSEAITRDRFRSWTRVLTEHTATPALCVAIGHGAREGEIHLVCVEDLSTDQIVAFLKHAIRQLERKGGVL